MNPTNSKSNVDGKGRELYIHWEEVDPQLRRYDIFDKGGKPLYKWADARKLAEFVGAVALGDGKYLDSLGVDENEWSDVTRSRLGDRRPFDKSRKDLHESVIGSGNNL